MVAIIHHSKCVRDVLNYNEQKVQQGKADLILASKFLCEIEELSFRHKLNRFHLINQTNPRVKTNTLHISLNFHPDDKLDKTMLHSIATAYMDKIGFGEQPFLVYQHTDAGHPHVHIVTSIVRSDGERINTHNIGRLLSEPARKEIEKDYGLKPAGLAEPKELLNSTPEPPAATYGNTGTKSAIARAVAFVSKKYRFCSIPEYNAALLRFNVHAETGLEGSYLRSADGIQYRMLDENGQKIGVPIKGSSLPGKPVMRSLRKRFAVNEVLREKYQRPLADEIRSIIKQAQPASLNDLKTALAAKNIDVLFRTNEAGRTYGITYIDHKTRCVFNGSHLGKDLSPVGLQRTFSEGIHTAGTERKTSYQQMKDAVIGNNNIADTNLSLNSLIEQSPSESMPYELSQRKRNKKKRRKNL